jgi:sulfide:quinone oxidoreductase
MRKKIVVVGSNIAGFTAAIELKKRLRDRHEIVVVSASSGFVFTPSLIWLPFGKRTRADVTFPLEPTYEKRGIRFVHAVVRRIDLEQRRLVLEEGEERYDHLVLATGAASDWDAVPGLGCDEGFTQSIFTLDEAERAAAAFEAYLRAPGPVVIGGVQGASDFDICYELLFNFAHEINKLGLRDKVLLTYLTAEPFLAHLGLGGFGRGNALTRELFTQANITPVINAEVLEVRPSEIVLTDGRTLPFAFAMLAPPLRGAEVVRACPSITDPRGFVVVDEYYRTRYYPEVYAAGRAVAVDPPTRTAVPCGVPKSGYMSEEMGKLVARNLVAELEGGPRVAMPPARIDAKNVIDAGASGIIMLGDHFLAPRRHAWMIPGPEAHWAKLAFEKYFLVTRRRGWA